ncbi:MAG: hypothetical protein AAF355_01115 [Myxococcota bacterium]
MAIIAADDHAVVVSEVADARRVVLAIGIGVAGQARSASSKTRCPTPPSCSPAA